MEQRQFVPDYTSLTADGAQWLVAKRPSVQLLGIDYLTVATYDDLKTPHEILLGKVRCRYTCRLDVDSRSTKRRDSAFPIPFVQGIIAVEGLNFNELRPGLHQLHCLPVKLQGSDGAPVRCITIG